MMIENLDEISFVKDVGLAGTSLTLRVTKEAGLIGVKKGDVVKVTLKRL